MDAGRWEEVKVLFGEALAQPAEQRASFLDAACGADDALRAQVVSLLDSYEEASGYFGDLAEDVLGAGWMDDDRMEPPPVDPHRLIGQTIVHYDVLDKLGDGGMGVVYKARDTRLERLVALKFLPPHLCTDPSAKERFIHEAQAASALDHVNIGTIHEINETLEGQLFIAMTYYEGETLKARLARGALAIADVLDVAIQIAQALVKAHGHGIVHRDVKPANVILTEPVSGDAAGGVKLIDFGLAKVEDITLTSQGVRLGTVAYMSPEQVLGKAIDTRTDVWSLGVVLYEMLAGERPFQGDSQALIFHAILHDEPPGLAEVRPDVPPVLAAVVHRALAKHRDHRFWTMKDMLAAIREVQEDDDERTRTMTFQPAIEPVPPSTSIVVLPFRDLSVAQGGASLGADLTDKIIADLSAKGDVHVITLRGNWEDSGIRRNVKAIGYELNARYVLEGSIRTAGDRVRITARLIDSNQDTHLWTEKFTDTLDNMSRLQEQVSEAIGKALVSLQRSA